MKENRSDIRSLREQVAKGERDRHTFRSRFERTIALVMFSNKQDNQITRKLGRLELMVNNCAQPDRQVQDVRARCPRHLRRLRG